MDGFENLTQLDLAHERQLNFIEPLLEQVLPLRVVNFLQPQVGLNPLVIVQLHHFDIRSHFPFGRGLVPSHPGPYLIDRVRIHLFNLI